ncbi:MAG: hypothetical protein IPI33_15630 [Dehalococcoidia bacterium]|nr:hypothetical protein [Dehalococcoidia bacterium]
MASAIAGIALAAIGMPIVFERWTQSRVEIVQTIYSLTPEKSVLVSNYKETQKVMNELYGERLVVDLEETDQSVLRRLFATGASEYVVLLLRTDGTYWQKRSADLQNRFETVAGAYDFRLILDRKATATDRLQIWKMKRRLNADRTRL